MEQPLYPNECCVLGSINLSNMYHSSFKWYNHEGCKTLEDFRKFIDWDTLRKTIEIAIKMLDNIIDKQQYPNEKFEKFHKANRKIGLGIMGFADLLIKLGVSYGSDLSFEIAKDIMEAIQSHGNMYSKELGEIKGIPDNLSKVDCKRRNATVTTIAPTGTLSLIAECSSGIEPNFDYEIHHNRLGGKYVTLHPLYKEFKEANGLSDYNDTFIKASEVKVENHIKMQAAFQKYTDNAVSKTINMPNAATIKDVKEAYELAYGLGCKGVTVYRDGSRGNQVLNSTDKKSQRPDSIKQNESGVGKEHKTSYFNANTPGYYKNIDSDIVNKNIEVLSERHSVIKKIDPENLPELMNSKRVKVKTPEGDIFINISFIDEKPYEIFINSPADTKHSEIYEALARLISAGLRYGVPLKEILSQLRKAYTKYGSVMSIPHAICKAFDKSYVFDNVKQDREWLYNIHKEYCPDCNNILVEEEGCKKCHSCGYSACN